MGKQLSEEEWAFVLEKVAPNLRQGVREYLSEQHTSVLEATFINNPAVLPVPRFPRSATSLTKNVVAKYISAVRIGDDERLFKDSKRSATRSWWAIGISVVSAVAAIVAAIAAVYAVLPK